MDSWRDIPKWRIGQFGGVPVYLDALYPLMLAAVPFSLLGRGFPSLTAFALFAAFAILGATLSILLHELGHAAAAKHYGVVTDQIRIGPFYGLAFLRGHAPARAADIAILLAGPLVNAAIFAWLWIVLGAPAINSQLYFGEATFTTFVNQHMLTSNAVKWLAHLNLGMLIFNLLPAFPLDGGQAARLVMNGKLPDSVAARRVAIAGIIAGAWAFFGAAAYRGLIEAGLFLIVANYAIARGQIPPPD